MLGSFEDVLNSIKCSPKKAVNSDSNKSPEHVLNTSDNTSKESDIVLEKIDEDKVVDSEPSDVDSEIVGIMDDGDSTVSEVLERQDSDRVSCSSSDIMEITPDIFFDTDNEDTEVESITPGDLQNEERRWEDREVRETKWELNAESEKFVEVGPNLKGIKLKKMAVLVKEEHDFNNCLAHGPVKTRVKMRNVRKQLGLLNKPMFEPIIVEKRSESTHPFICPFYCPVYNVPCEAMFKVTEQEYFMEHVSNKNCPYAPRNDPPVEYMIQCEKCGDSILESQMKSHLDENHHTHTCPGCKGKFECKMDVEDHIINEHATHFMSNLQRIYRRPEFVPPVPKTYIQDDSLTFTPDPQTPLQPYIGHSLDGRHVPTEPLPPPAPLPSSSVRLIAPQKKVVYPPGAPHPIVAPRPLQIVHQAPPHNAAPRLVFVQQQQASNIHQPGNQVWIPPGQRMVTSNGLVRSNTGKLLKITPGLVGNLARQASPASSTSSLLLSNTVLRTSAPIILGNTSNTSASVMLGNTSNTPTPVMLGNRAPTPGPMVLGSKARLQQLRLPTGQLVWAQPVASEAIPGSDKAKIQFKVVGPVKDPQQAPGVLAAMGNAFNTHNPHAPTMKKYNGPLHRAQAPATSKSTVYRHIVPRASSQASKPARMAQPL